MSLVQFLSDLRADLAAARARAVQEAAEQLSSDRRALWFELGEVSVSLEVAHTNTVSGEVSAEVEGKFWVFGSAKAGAKAGGESARSGTQTLTLALKPWFQELKHDSDGNTTVVSSQPGAGVNIAGNAVPGER
jgi:hypothetical protein